MPLAGSQLIVHSMVCRIRKSRKRVDCATPHFASHASGHCKSMTKLVHDRAFCTFPGHSRILPTEGSEDLLRCNNQCARLSSLSLRQALQDAISPPGPPSAPTASCLLHLLKTGGFRPEAAELRAFFLVRALSLRAWHPLSHREASTRPGPYHPAALPNPRLEPRWPTARPLRETPSDAAPGRSSGIAGIAPVAPLSKSAQAIAGAYLRRDPDRPRLRRGGGDRRWSRRKPLAPARQPRAAQARGHAVRLQLQAARRLQQDGPAGARAACSAA